MQKVLNYYRKFISGMGKTIDVIAILLMLAMVGVVFYQVIMRQIFERPPIWGEEISVSLMVWFVFLGIALGLQENLHIGITMFVSKLPKKVQFVLEIFVNLLILIFAVILLVYGYSLASQMFGFGTAMPATGLPAAIHYTVVPISGAMMGLITVGKIAGLIIDGKEQAT